MWLCWLLWMKGVSCVCMCGFVCPPGFPFFLSFSPFHIRCRDERHDISYQRHQRKDKRNKSPAQLASPQQSLTLLYLIDKYIIATIIRKELHCVQNVLQQVQSRTSKTERQNDQCGWHGKVTIRNDCRSSSGSTYPFQTGYFCIELIQREEEIERRRERERRGYGETSSI